jgi:hypothetical protein
LDIVISLEFGLSQTIDDVLVDDDPQSCHQKGKINLHGNTVDVKEFIGDRKLSCDVATATDFFVIATIAEEIG